MNISHCESCSFLSSSSFSLFLLFFSFLLLLFLLLLLHQSSLIIKSTRTNGCLIICLPMGEKLNALNSISYKTKSGIKAPLQTWCHGDSWIWRLSGFWVCIQFNSVFAQFSNKTHSQIFHNVGCLGRFQRGQMRARKTPKEVHSSQ